MSNITHVYFDGLGIDFNLPSVAFSVFGYDIHWYGIIIAFGFALAVLYGGRKAYKWKMSLDGMTDVLIWGTLFGIICARLYYVAFEWDYYSQHLNEIPAIWNGGIGAISLIRRRSAQTPIQHFSECGRQKFMILWKVRRHSLHKRE